MQKTKSMLLATMLTLTLTATMIPIFVIVANAQAAGTPTQFIEYSSVWAQATASVPNIGNITSMTVTPIHQNRSSTTDNYDVLSLVLSSNLTTAPVVASISTNTNASDIAWRQALRNGSTTYMNINGTVTVNNLLLVNPNELTIRKNVSGSSVSVSVDFNPSTMINITLPLPQFPRANFSATWAVPAFHTEWVGVRNSTIGNSTSNNPSGWREYNEFNGYSANYTLNVPSWSNYTTAGTSGTIREFNVHRGYAPAGIVIPTNATKTMDFLNGYGQFTVDIPRTGGITRMVINVGHIEQGIMGFPVDLMGVTLSATGFNGTVTSTFTTNPSTDADKWLKTLYNGTSRYTQAGNNITINNILRVNASELVVRRNGTRLTADFNPATPKNITLPVAQFPPTNFSATFTMPAFHLDIDANSTQAIYGNSPSTFLSGWINNNYYVAAATNATISIPSMNVTSSSNSSSQYLLPYMASFYAGPLNTSIIPEFSGPMAIFVSVTVVLVTAGAAVLKKRARIVKPY